MVQDPLFIQHILSLHATPSLEQGVQINDLFFIFKELKKIMKHNTRLCRVVLYFVGRHPAQPGANRAEESFCKSQCLMSPGTSSPAPPLALHCTPQQAPIPPPPSHLMQSSLQACCTPTFKPLYLPAFCLRWCFFQISYDSWHLNITLSVRSSLAMLNTKVPMHTTL